MRTFDDIYSLLDLEEFLDSCKGTLYCGPSEPATPEILVRRSDGDFSSDLVPVFVDINKSMSGWIKNHPDLEKYVILEGITEIGVDFVSRPFYIYQTSLRYYDDATDRSQVPDELESMRQQLKKEIGTPNSERDKLVEKILEKSLLQSATKTNFNWKTNMFYIVEPALAREDLLKWKELSDF